MDEMKLVVMDGMNLLINIYTMEPLKIVKSKYYYYHSYYNNYYHQQQI